MSNRVATDAQFSFSGMSYENIKKIRITTDKVFITSCSNNVWPQNYKEWESVWLSRASLLSHLDKKDETYTQDDRQKLVVLFSLLLTFKANDYGSKRSIHNRRTP